MSISYNYPGFEKTWRQRSEEEAPNVKTAGRVTSVYALRGGKFERVLWDDPCSEEEFKILDASYKEIFRSSSANKSVVINMQTPQPMLKVKPIENDDKMMKASKSWEVIKPYKFRLSLLSVVVTFVLLLTFATKASSDLITDTKFRFSCGNCHETLNECSADSITFDTKALITKSNDTYLGVSSGYKQTVTEGNSDLYCKSKAYSERSCELSCLNNGTLTCFIPNELKHLAPNKTSVGRGSANCICSGVRIISIKVLFYKEKEIEVESTKPCRVGNKVLAAQRPKKHIRGLLQADDETIIWSDGSIATNHSGQELVSMQYVNNVFSVLISDAAFDGSRVVVLLSKGGEEHLTQITSQHTIISVPMGFKLTSGEMKAKLYIGSSLILQKEFMIIGETICRVSDCLLCEETFSTFHCMSSTYQFIIVTFIIILAYILLMIASKVFWFIINCITVVKFMCGKRKAKVVESKEEDEEEMAFIPAYSKMPRKSGSKAMAIFGLSMILPTLKACDSGIFIPSTSADCRQKNGVEECVASFDLTASIPFPDSYSCVTIGDIKTGHPIAQFRVKYKHAKSQIGLSTKYHTALWAPLQFSTHYCATQSPCDQVCGGISPNDNPGGVFNDAGDLANLPGISYCHTNGGCVSNGCFSCGSACTYTRWGMRTLTGAGEMAEVFDISYRTTTVMIEIQRQVKGVWEDFTSVTSETESVTVDGWTISLIGKLTPSSVALFGSNDIIKRNSNDWFYGHTSQLNEPTVGSFGDIQSNDETSLSTVSQHSFIFNPSMASCNQAKYDQCNFLEPGFKLLDTPAFTKFPAQIGGSYWTANRETGEISSLLNDPGAVLVTIKTDSPVKFLRIVSSVCPSFEVITASGCFDCDPGFAIVIRAVSSCQEGLVIVTTDDSNAIMSTHALFIKPVSDQYVIYGRTNRVSNSFSITLTSDGSSDTKVVSFTAVPGVYKTRNDTWIKGDVIQSGSDHDETWYKPFTNFFESIGNLFGGSWVAGVMTILLGFVLVILIVKLSKKVVEEMRENKAPAKKSQE